MSNIGKVVTWNGSKYGIIGEEVGVRAYENGYSGKVYYLRVGDVVSFEECGLTFSGVVLKKSEGIYGVMGFGVDRLNFKRITITVPCERVSEDFISTLHGGSEFTFEDVEIEEMTVREIEKELGKRIKIVK